MIEMAMTCSRNSAQKRRLCRCVALLATLVALPVLAQPDEDRPGLHLPNMDSIRETGAWSWLENQRDTVSRGVSGVGRYLDDWLAGDGVGEHSNQSYLRLKLNQQVSETGAYYSNLRISGRVDLPRATERWKLIFESEQTDQESIQNQRLSNIRPSEFSGGFSYQLPETNSGFRFTHDVGVKGRIPLDPFYRFKTRYGHDLSETWALGVDHKLWYYHVEGWGQDGRLFFTRRLRDDMFLRFDTEAHFRNRHDAVEYAQTVALHRTLGERETLTYEGGVIGNTRPTSRINSYYAQTVYRKAIHEDWLVMELVPQLVMERDNDWKVDPRIQFNLEIYFFDF